MKRCGTLVSLIHLFLFKYVALCELPSPKCTDGLNINYVQMQCEMEIVNQRNLKPTIDLTNDSQKRVELW